MKTMTDESCPNSKPIPGEKRQHPQLLSMLILKLNDSTLKQKLTYILCVPVSITMYLGLYKHAHRIYRFM